MSILSSLMTSASALDAYSQVLSVIQNNVVNGSTPGYARQSMSLEAGAFDPAKGLGGGVRATEIKSSRDEFAEQAVRQQNTLLGGSSQSVSTLTQLQNNFDISGTTGIPAALNNLFQAFSAWGQSPTNGSARQTVINNAVAVANAFQDTANGLEQLTQNTNVQLQQTVTQVNQLVGQLAEYNSRIMAGDRNDAGLDAQVHSTLEQLSQYVDFSATKQNDGSFTLLLNGQTQLLIGSRQFQLNYDLEQPTTPPPVNDNGPPRAYIRSSDGADVTTQTTGGQLGALLNLRDTVLPSYLGDAYQAGDLNSMAKQFADRVNQILTQGTSDDPTVTSGGVPLFTYTDNDPTSVARSLAVNPGATTTTLVPVDPVGPVSNGIPLALSNLENPTQSADQINGESFTAFYGDMATRAGNLLNLAKGAQQVQQSALAQAQNLRQQESGVDLDEEAMSLVQYQTAYEANSKIITVLDQLTQDVVNILGS